MDDVTPRAPYERDETVAHRLDRNYAEQLQELRVVQTGVQVLFAFLLSIAFQQRFRGLDTAQRTLYLVTLISSALAAVLLIAPAAAHRVLFGRHRKDEVVELSGRFAAVGMACLAVAILTAVAFVLDFVVGAVAGVVAAGALGVVLVTTWVVLPAMVRRRPDEAPIPQR